MGTRGKREEQYMLGMDRRTQRVPDLSYFIGEKGSGVTR